MVADKHQSYRFTTTIALPGGRRIPLEHIERDRSTREKYLAPYRGKKADVLCMCRREGIPMGIGKRQVPSVVYYLYPLHRSDPQRHALSCPNHSSLKKIENIAEKSESKPTIEIKDGKIQINLWQPLYLSRPIDGQERGNDKDELEIAGTKTTQPSRGKLLTILEVLWSEAELNLWRPWFEGRRHYGVIYHRLTEAATKIRLRSQDLSPLLYIPPPFRENQIVEIQASRDRFIEMLCENKGRIYYGYVIGLLKEVTDNDGENIAIRLAHTSMQLWIKRKRWLRARKEWLTDTNIEQPVVVIARVMRHDGKINPWLTVEEMAILSLSDDKAWIPVESRFERMLATKLVSEGRCFRKPLSCETAENQLLPDFILEDREDRLHMEVIHWISNPETQTLIIERRSRYEQIKQAVWWWDTNCYEDVPYFPSIAKSSQRERSIEARPFTAQQTNQPELSESSS